MEYFDLYQVGGPPSYEEVFKEIYNVDAVRMEYAKTMTVTHAPVMRAKLSDQEIKLRRMENKNRASLA